MGIIKNYIAYGVPKTQRLKYSDSKTIGYEPIVQKPIPLTASEHNQFRSEITLLGRNADDLTRISTLLRQPPGIQFITNQNDLHTVRDQRTARDKIIQNSNRQDGGISSLGGLFKSKLVNAVSTIVGGLGQTVKTVASTLAQVPVNGTGTHFVIGFNGTSRQTYLSGMDTPPHEIVRSGGKVFPDVGVYTQGGETVGGTRINPDDRLQGTENLTGLKDSDEIYDFQTQGSSKQTSTPTVTSNSLLSGENFASSLGLDRAVNVLKDVKQRLGSNIAKIPLQLRGEQSALDETIIDQVNSVQPYSGDVDESIADLIKFRFNIIEPDKNTVLHFRAYLDSLDDNFNGDWNAWKYNGRAENFYTYSGFERTLSLSFKIAAHTQHEMEPLYKKIVLLASSTAPSYNSEGVMRGTLVKMTVGDYLSSMPGYISNVNYTWDKNYPWEVNDSRLNSLYPEQQLPHVLDCSIQFTPIHTFAPQTGYFHYITRKGDGEMFAESPTGRVAVEAVGGLIQSSGVKPFGLSADSITQNLRKKLLNTAPPKGTKEYRQWKRDFKKDKREGGMSRKLARQVLKARLGG